MAPHWKAVSLEAVSDAVPELGCACPEGTKLLLVLLCFLARADVPLNLCVRGAIPRKRWNVYGEAEEIEAVQAGLVPELVGTLSNRTDLEHALSYLQSKSAVLTPSDSTCFLDPATSTCILSNLSPKLQSFWKHQALVIASRSIPWKYLEFEPSGNLFSTHLRHTVEAVQNDGGLLELEPNYRIDLALTLVEASRFPGMEWKRFAIDQAKEAARGLDDGYVQSCIAQRECLLSRITGDMVQAARAINKASSALNAFPVTAEKRAHTALGQVAIQHALNRIQIDDLVSATTELNAWQPLGRASAFEEATLFRKLVILGKILRFEGRFNDALAYLEKAKSLIDCHQNVFFNEDKHDLVCNLTDTLIELERPVDAEHYLRTEIAYLPPDCTSTGRPLKLALAESLFSQRRYEEAERICFEMRLSTLPKMEKLRLAIIQAKLSHVSSNLDAAFQYWTEAMGAVSKFARAKGHTTRIILLSICDVLRRQGQHDLELQSRDQLATLEKLAGTGGALYWIAGLRQWLGHLHAPDGPHL